MRVGRVPVAVAGVLVLAAAFRLGGLHWDAHRWEEPGRPAVLEETHLHPDERFLTMVTDALRWPDSVTGYLDTAASPLNPHNRGFRFFAYGTLPVFLTKAAGDLAGHHGYDRIHIVGRVLSAAFDLATVLLTLVLGRRLFGAPVGLVGALLLALAVLPIQQAHFYTVDTFATTFVMLALVATARIVGQPRARDHAGLGLALGAGLACKVSVASLAGFVVAAMVVGTCGGQLAGEAGRGIRARLAAVLRGAPVLAGRLALVLGVALVTFRLLQPYAFRGPGLLDVEPNPAWLADLRQVAQLLEGLRDFPPGHQWTDRTPIWFPWTNLVLVGTGPALGLAAWGGWMLAGWELWRRRGRPAGSLLLWAWVLVFFLYQGTRWVASLRYFLSIYPALALFAAFLLVRAWERARAAPRWQRAAAAALAVVVVGGSFAWAWAFTSIYRRPHARVEASRWIYAQIPPGAVLAVEHWDDALPLRLLGRQPSTVYRRLELPSYDDDTPEKLGRMLAVLDEAEYVILSSNRVSDSVLRLPARYPMTTRYYHALFSGELGFARVAEFTAYPRLLGIEFPDQGAEEAFSVYDHPRVQVFRKTAAWSEARARSLLDRDDWEEVLRLRPREAEQVRHGLRLDAATRAAQRAGGTWSRLYDPGDLANRLPVAAWALALALIGLLAFPLTALALGTLEDRGFLLAKAVGLLVVASGAWWLASLRILPFGRASVALAMAALAALSGLAAWWQRRELRWLWQARWRLLLAEEALFWLLFGAMLLVRWQNPDLWHPVRGGEKPMDLAYLNAVLKSGTFPPYDPWFAGGYLNYYYFGFVLVGSLVKLTGIVPSVAYNLAIPTFFALTGAGAFTAAAALVRALDRGASPTGRARGGGLESMGWGGLGMLAVTVAGNLASVRLLADALARLSSLDPSVALPVRAVHGLYLWAVEGRVPPVPTEWWYWNASRAIPHPPTEAPPITEFPYFAFLFGDLHAHVLALPYTLLVLAAAIHLVADGDRPDRPGERGGAREASILGLLGLATGMLWAINAWDVPTALVVVGLGLGLREVGRRGALDRAAGVAAAWRLLVVLALGRLLVHPYSAHFARAYGSFEPWGGSRTPLHAYLAIHGLFLFGLATYLALSLRGEGGGAAARRWVPGVGLALAAGLAACGLGLPALLVGLATVALPVAIGPGRRPPERLVAGLILLGVGLGAAVELVALRGDAGRMNTVFKVYLQVWALWGVAAVAGPALALRARGPGPRRGRLFRWWAVGGLGLLATALLYPVLATPARLRHRVDPAAGPGLDGEAYIDRAVVRDQGREILLAWDADAIRWLREHVPGSPVVLEASIPPYRWGSRVSVYTGLPTVLGWESHQRQQRAALPGGPVRRRLDAVRRIYTASDPESVLGLLRRYEVRYVYVGPLERLYYGGPGLDKFESARAYFEPVFENPGVRIYRVVGP